MLLDALWKSADPDEALNQFERFLSAAGPRAGLVELLADRPELLTGLVRVCAGGDLLTQLLIAQPELLASLAAPERLLRGKARPAYRAAVAQVFASGLGPGERRGRLRRGQQAGEPTVVGGGPPRPAAGRGHPPGETAPPPARPAGGRAP